jgi:hypothetical protein
MLSTTSLVLVSDGDCLSKYEGFRSSILFHLEIRGKAEYLPSPNSRPLVFEFGDATPDGGEYNLVSYIFLPLTVRKPVKTHQVDFGVWRRISAAF